MPSLTEVAQAHTELGEQDLAWLHLLVADWQIVADLSFADLVLWLPDRDGQGLWAGAQIRPTTGPTSYVDDLVGSFLRVGRRPLIDAALEQNRVVREGDPEWRDDVPVRVEAIPVRRKDRTLAVVARNTNLLGVRTPSRLELAYLETAAELTQMISTGHFPHSAPRSDHTDAARVGDGFVRLDSTGVVSYASPNALSVYRRLGLTTDLTGLELAATTRQLIPVSRRPDEETLSAVLGGTVPADTEMGTAGTVVIARSVPLRGPRGHAGALVLLRDVTDLRSRDRELLTKDATIREIHHRVKNNLQTVAALLRLQSRRTALPEARAGLDEAVRRVGSIALVHETLSRSLDETVAFDGIADRLRAMVADMHSSEAPIRIERLGSFGVLSAELATPLAMVLTELLQNAIEHAFAGGPGVIEVRARRDQGTLEVEVADDGSGFSEEFDPEQSASLGLSIVRTLVESEMGGSLAFRSSEQGTNVGIIVPLAGVEV